MGHGIARPIEPGGAIRDAVDHLLQRIDGVLIDVSVGLASMSHSRLGPNEGNTALRGRGFEGRSLRTLWDERCSGTQ
jgi:hypothetical protein